MKKGQTIEEFMKEPYWGVKFIIYLIISGLIMYWLFVPSSTTRESSTNTGYTDKEYACKYVKNYIRNCSSKQGDDYVRCLAIAPEAPEGCR